MQDNSNLRVTMGHEQFSTALTVQKVHLFFYWALCSGGEQIEQ
jgi:hypothetical protein